ncbi:MAG: methyltransferase domain-containing protein [Paucibacter sp.]|nr:methyltransferase domain-containing protein [Roseateles sp.]
MSVFNTHYADQYDRLYASKDYSGECDLIQAALQRFSAKPPERLLDVGCGTGGHTIELARRGYQLTGVDLSAAMLEHARQKAKVLDAFQPHWVCGDARSFEAGSSFDAAIMMFAVIGYLTSNDDVLAGLRNIRRHLKPGAVFVCDFWYGPTVLMQGPSDRVRVLDIESGQVIRTTQTQLDVVRHTADVAFRLWHLEGQQVLSQTEETHRLRYFFPQEFAGLLAQAGFRQDSLSAFPSLSAPLDEHSWNALVVATAI